MLLLKKSWGEFVGVKIAITIVQKVFGYQYRE